MNNSDFYSDDNDEELFTYGEDSAADPVFRSIKVESGFHTEHFTAFQQSAHFNAPQSIQFYKADVNSKSSSETSTGCCPSVPFGVPNTKFNIIKSNYTLVMQSVSENLHNHDNFDFALCEDEFMWRGKYLKGSSCFELEINLYHDKGSDKYTVAVRKVVSDCSINGTFDAFFTAMKAALCNDPECLKPAAPARKRFVIPTNCSLMTVTDDDFLNGVQSIFRMCECSSLETRVQGAKMLCDLSLKSAHFLELPAFAPRCAALLETLVHDEVDDVRQHAVMAVAAFAELDSYREAFLRSDVLPALFQLVENCQYETAQMRRTAAAVLALLCRTHPYLVRNELRQHDHCVDLNAWLQRAPLLQDARTRESALVVKACMEEGGVPAAADCDCDQHLHGGLMSEEEATLFALSH